MLFHDVCRTPVAAPLLPGRLRAEPFRLLRELGLPAEDLLIAGSAPLYVRGLRDRIGDLDVVARGEALRRALVLGRPEPAPFDGAVSIRLMGGRLEITDSWFVGMFGEVEDLFDRAERIGGFRFLTVADTVVWKQRLDRPKDRLDLQRMAEPADRDRSTGCQGRAVCSVQPVVQRPGTPGTGRSWRGRD
ncbi:hypothetical protein OU787_16850 [Kitasatospora sp. YST-16]|uniref:hypothetical protein n=1 Tax=Kitasatospora sp. YST-16 TaxID=2998080 RepID=UPI00228479A3|nr:hypothetical protein [Kitasatospora sp. YST-16]WAL73025.1 hypothetical protein OU787_16850 [Kitasatospora sp. YST-16]WNW39076.1 hypothetical protein RKE32_16805 [Streptomyces sp. Li-HN-5-13]